MAGSATVQKLVPYYTQLTYMLGDGAVMKNILFSTFYTSYFGKRGPS
jgi:hypothetical protein